MPPAQTTFVPPAQGISYEQLSDSYIDEAVPRLKVDRKSDPVFTEDEVLFLRVPKGAFNPNTGEVAAGAFDIDMSGQSCNRSKYSQHPFDVLVYVPMKSDQFKIERNDRAARLYPAVLPGVVRPLREHAGDERFLEYRWEVSDKPEPHNQAHAEIDGYMGDADKPRPKDKFKSKPLKNIFRGYMAQNMLLVPRNSMGDVPGPDAVSSFP